MELEQTIVSIEDSFLLTSRLNMHVIETPIDIQLGEVFSSTKL